MAKLMRWILLLTLVLATAAIVVSADGWLPSFGQKSAQDKAKDQTAETVEGAKSWTSWASEKVPYFSGSAAKRTNEKLDDSKEASKDTVTAVGEEGQKSADSAKGYAAKTKDAAAGFAQRWGGWANWAKDNVGKYYAYGPLAKKATDVSTKVVSDHLDSSTDTGKETVDTPKEDVKTEDKEL